MRKLLAFLLLVSAFSCGCVHTQLRHNSVNQAATLTNFYQEQVLDNLAMFAVDPYSLPFFALPAEGLNQLTQQNSTGADLDWARSMGGLNFSALGIGTNATRTTDQSWELDPVTDPRKLARMRCAYQHAIAACQGRVLHSHDCPDCDKLLDKFYGNGDDGGGLTKRCVEELASSQWFGVGCKSEVPKCRECTYVGNHCGCYVWVKPGCRDKLAQLTMAVLEYALRDPPPEKPTAVKTVVYHIDEKGNPAKEEDAVAQVTQVIPATASTPSLWEASTSRLEAQGVPSLERKLNQLGVSLVDLLDSDNISAELESRMGDGSIARATLDEIDAVKKNYLMLDADLKNDLLDYMKAMESIDIPGSSQRPLAPEYQRSGGSVNRIELQQQLNRLGR